MLLKSWLGIKLPKYVSKLGWFTFVALVLVFLYFTYTRFGTSMLFSIFSYFSQQLTNFNDLFVLNPPVYNGSMNFYNIRNYLGLDNIEPGALHYYYLSNNIYPWIFSFFIGSLVADLGRLNALFLIGIFSLCMFIILINKNKTHKPVVSLYQLLLYSFYGQIGYMGLFYFKHSALNNYMLATLVFALLLWLFKLITRFSFILSNKTLSYYEK